MNKIILIGNLTKDAELVTLSTTHIAKMSIAVSGTYKKEDVNFFNCTAFGKLADICGKYCKKGKKVAITGRLESDRVDDRTYWEVIAETIELLSPAQQKDSPHIKNGEEVKEDLPF